MKEVRWSVFCRSSELRSDAGGVVLRDVVVYIDDSSAQGGAGVEVSAKPAECTLYMHCRYL